MDQGLFGKYIVAIKKREGEQENLIAVIKEKSGVELLPKEIIISKKTISFQTSSVKKTVLIHKKIKNLLEEKGYIVKL